MNEYINKLVNELSESGVKPMADETVSSEHSNVTDTELKVIADLEKINGAVFSDEQKKILTHKGSACILACAGSGKALVNGTGILTPTGYKPIEDMQVGDIVYDEKGNKQQIVGVYPQGKKQVYRVTFSDRTVIECCGEHLWNYQTYRMRHKSNDNNKKANSRDTNSNWRTATLDYIYNNISLSSSGNRRNIYIPMTEPVKFSKKALTIKPYVLGVILGSGVFNSNSCYTLNMTEGDIVDRVREELKDLEVEIVDTKSPNIYRLKCGRALGHKGILTDVLDKLGLLHKTNCEKFIPSSYKYSSIKDRKALLAGIIDVRGNCTGTGTGYEITLKSEQLIDDLKDIIESLGLTAVKSEREVNWTSNGIVKYGKAYRLCIKCSVTIPKIHYSIRHERKWRGSDLIARRAIVNIEKTNEEKEMTCIKVSGYSELFLTEHCVVTHNTTVSVNLIAKRIATGEINPDRLLYTTYSKSGTLEMKERLSGLLKKLGIHKEVQVRTLHSFFLSIIRTFGINSDIISDTKRTMFVKEACKDAGYTLKDDDLTLIDTLLSYQVNNMLSDKQTIDSYVNTLDQLSYAQYTSIRQGYYTRKKKANLIDYDDMQSYLYAWFVKLASSDQPEQRETSKQAKNYCRALYDYFFIDEAQDISKIQYEIIRAIVENPNEPGKLDKDLVFIGDDDQCLITGTEVITEAGKVPIESINKGDNVLSCVGHGEVNYMNVNNRSTKTIDDDIVVIKTKTGKEIKGTYNHIGFARLVVANNIHYVYLMYKYGYGFRIGNTYGLRVNSKKKGINGLDIRLSQEKADKLWILKTCDTEQEANYVKTYLSYKYGIPMCSFENKGKAIISNEEVKKLHAELDTTANGFKLLDALRIEYKYPHKVLKARDGRYTINSTMFGAVHRGEKGIYAHSMTVTSPNKEYVGIVNSIFNGEIGSKSKKKGEQELKERDNIRITSSNIDKQHKLIDKALNKCSMAEIKVEPIYEARLTEDNKYKFIPLGNIVKGMRVPVYSEKEQRIIEDEVIEVTHEHYKGNVYDLSVPYSRNFIANGIAVHNCIYQWRGSDPSIILSVGPQFNIDTFVLSTNYRCATEVVDYATTGIKCNVGRYAKGMNAFNTGGEVKIAISDKPNLMTLSILALNHIKYLLANGENPSDIAVLARNNFHLALLNNMLFRNGICCNMTNDMKLTKSYMFKDMEMLLDLSEESWDNDITSNILWKLCRYIKAATARLVGNMQCTSGLSLRQTLGYLLKSIIGVKIDFNERINIPAQIEAKVRFSFSYSKPDTINDLLKLYNILNEKDAYTKFFELIHLYIDNTSSYLYKTEDKNRSINGLGIYLLQLAKIEGMDKLRDFIKYTKQYENSNGISFGDEITLTTEHSAKGREWKNVIMFACDNVSQPSLDNIATQVGKKVPIEDIYNSINEERRLHYVGNTRAKENLLVITNDMPSMFILEALGIIKDNYNLRIYNLALHPEERNYYIQDVAKLIKDKNSKYFYNPEDYKV